jgi:hypothetical protein
LASLNEITFGKELEELDGLGGAFRSRMRYPVAAAPSKRHAATATQMRTR